VDFGGFNLCLCRAARRLGLPVFYYIPPQVWAHGRYRLKKLRKWVSRCGLIYPFEADLYRRWGVEAQYVGHPLFDELQRHPPSAEIVAKLEGRFGPNLVGLFPGSRRQEVRAHMPVLAAACQQVRQAVPDASFTLLCPPDVRPLASQAVPAESGIEVLDGVRAVELAQASRICLAKSGTVTLEIASQGTPMVIFYRMAPFVCFIGYGLAQVPYMGIVNNLAGRMVCPERPMSRDEPGWLAAEAIRLLRDREAHECCREELRRVIEPLARPGASLRAARSALELIEGAR
jgi:lipid-A-disaccharide synthase